MAQLGSSQVEILKRIYYTPSNPGAFSSVAKLFNEAKKEIPTLTLDNVKDWLKSQITYTLHRSARRKFSRNRIIVSKIDEQWEADLVEMQEFSTKNSGYKYILTVIDCFSKFAWAQPLKNKTGKSIHDAFAKLFNTRTPEALRTDKGKEFINRMLQTLLASHNIRYYTSNNPDVKCAIVERFNRTLKSRMYRYFTSKGTRKFTDVLSSLVEGYNKSMHRTIGMAPVDVNFENSYLVFKKTYGKKSLRELYQDQKLPLKLKEGDEVRLKYKIGPFDKGFYPNWTDQVYKVSGIDKINKKPVFVINDYNGDRVEKRKFYNEELQNVDAEVYRIEKILKRRIYKGKTQYLVKWLGYTASFNTWIDSEKITTIAL